MIYPGGSRATLAYDQAGRLTRVVDENGNATEYTYNALSRLLTATNEMGTAFIK